MSQKFYVLQFENDDVDLNKVFSDDARLNQRLNKKLNAIASYDWHPDITNGMFCTLVYVDGMEGVKKLIQFARTKSPDVSYIVYEMKEVKVRVK